MRFGLAPMCRLILVLTLIMRSDPARRTWPYPTAGSSRLGARVASVTVRLPSGT